MRAHAGMDNGGAAMASIVCAALLGNCERHSGKIPMPVKENKRMTTLNIRALDAADSNQRFLQFRYKFLHEFPRSSFPGQMIVVSSTIRNKQNKLAKTILPQQLSLPSFAALEK